jgi:UDP-N-acetylmuramoylalanine--D-glutamate ligase
VPLTIEGLEEARDGGVHVIGELELAVAEIKTPVVAVTGTNGKTTTTALIGHLLTQCGVKNCVGGNIGTALTDLIYDANKADWVVVEVSSFQLETTPSLAPKIGVLLNITPDHLDRHASFEEYIDLKIRVLGSLCKEGTGLYNARDKIVAKAIKKFRAELVPFNSVAKMDKGGWFEAGALCTKIKGKEVHRYKLDKVSLVGAHNRENMLASAMVAELCGCAKEKIQRGLESFKGLPHRIELVDEHGGIRYYDDSKGTNVGATASALENFPGPVILIAGGLDKGSSYAPLASPIKERVKRLILIGEAKEKMMDELGSLTETVVANTMEEAVCKANAVATKGDVVLLSPACASYDMFRDYAERGEVFARAVKKRCWVKE